MDVARIAADRVHGASYLVVRAAELLRAAIDGGEDADCAAVELAKAQPAMAPLFNLANRVLLCRDSSQVRAVLQDVIGGAERRVEQAARVAAAQIAGARTVFTHSRSAAVERALSMARVPVMATESRPMREGVELALSLARAGVPVRVVADAGMHCFMADADVVLVGADAVGPQGVVNKLGTALLAQSAREFHVPVFVVCTLDKFLPPRVQLKTGGLRAPEEIVPERHAGVAVSNVYFESTPLDWFAGVFTEDGVMTVADVRARLAECVVHPLLAEAFR